MKARITSNEFVAAITESLKDLIDRGKPITQTSVINNARTSNGDPVGKTTLYRKNDKTGEPVHQDLIDAIEVAKNDRKRKTGIKTHSETIVGLKKEKAELEREKQRLIDKVVQQEADLINLERGVGINSASIGALEGELYVAHSLLLKRHPELKDFAALVAAFERKHKDKAHLEHLKKRIETLDADIQYSTAFNAKFGNSHR